MKVAFLSRTDDLRNTLTTMISFFFFLGYLLNSGTAGKWINACGYKVTLMRALIFMVGGLLLYSLSSWVATNYNDANVAIGNDIIPWGYFIFLLGSFLMGSSAAMLQVVINPYVSAYELPGTNAVQRMNIVCGINSIGTTIGPFFVSGVVFAGVALDAVSPGQLMMPFLLIAGTIVIVTAVTSRLHLPDLSDTRSAEREGGGRSVWSFRHLALGVVAIFFYVGTEVSIGVNVNLHAMQLIESGHRLSFFGLDRIEVVGLDLGIPALLATLYWGGMMIGRLLFSCVNNVSPKRLLMSTSVLASVLIIIAMITDNLWVLVSVGLCHSVMWGCIFTLAVAGLKNYTSKASGVFMMGVFGGAVFPVLQGFMADELGSWQWTWSIALVCELVMLSYAIWGCKVTDKEALQNIHLSPVDPG
ncbi:MAG: hypothetical protein NC349_07430 [Paenibacillus sp.]|nr:hypothetical protein [Paenibacillus sp.]